MPRSEEELDAMAQAELMKMASEIPGSKVIPMGAAKITLLDGSEIEVGPYPLMEEKPMRVYPKYIFIEYGEEYKPDRGETITQIGKWTGMPLPRRKVNTILATEDSIFALVETAMDRGEDFAVFRVGDCLIDRSNQSG
jgi:hypothetical protein